MGRDSRANFPRAAALEVNGDPFKIVNFYPTVVIQCQCERKTVLVLIGTDNIVSCPACKDRFVIADQMAVSVGALAKEDTVLQ